MILMSPLQLSIFYNTVCLKSGPGSFASKEHKGCAWTKEHNFTFLCPNVPPGMFCYGLRSDIQISVMKKAQNKHEDRSPTHSTVFPKVLATDYCQRWHTEPGGLVNIAALFQEINVT